MDAPSNNDDVDGDWWKNLPDLHLDDGEDGGDNDEEKKEQGNDENAVKYPSDWQCVEGEFALLCVTNLQWIAEDTCMGGKDWAGAKSNSLRLVYNENTGRMNYASAMLGLDTGKHLELDYVKHVDVTEMVIEPLG